MLLKRWREEEKAGARFTLESSEQHCVCGPLNFFYLLYLFNSMLDGQRYEYYSFNFTTLVIELSRCK